MEADTHKGRAYEKETSMGTPPIRVIKYSIINHRKNAERCLIEGDAYSTRTLRGIIEEES